VPRCLERGLSGAGGLKQPYDFGISFPPRMGKGGEAVIVAGVYVGTGVDQLGCDRQVRVPCRPDQRCTAVLVFPVRVRAAGDQIRDDILVSVDGRPDQRGTAVFVR